MRVLARLFFLFLLLPGLAFGQVALHSVGTTPLVGGTNGALEYNNNGVLGEISPVDLNTGSSFDNRPAYINVIFCSKN